MSKKEDTEHEARIALLAYFSSKSSNQAIIILTLVLLSLTTIEVAQFSGNLYQKNTFLALSLAVFFALSIRAIGRLLYWGKLARAICEVGILDEQTALSILTAEEEEYCGKLKKEGVNLVPTELYRLEGACNHFAKLALSAGKINTPYRLTDTWKKFFVFCVICSIILLFLFFSGDITRYVIGWFN